MTDTQQIKDKLDIAQFIAEYVPLKKAGIYWKACCPFHKEKTPSFMVNTERQSWHCFGCGKGGDVFSFLQEMEGMDFPEALKLLAERAGVKLDNNFQSEVNKSQKNRLLEINAKAAYFFNHVLTEMSAAQMARDYLDKRGLKAPMIAEWQVGFVPEQWDLLTQYLIKKGIGIDDLVVAGLTIKKDPSSPSATPGKLISANISVRYYDRFRGRIMFPICNVHGDVVGFTGRILVEKENSGGKYVNTPETPVYHKSEVIYGLNKAKTEIKAKDLAVLVEGQMDVIACYGAGMKNVVAASGTALTAEQVRLIKRYTSNIAMAFDADQAGINAAKRGIDVAIKEGLSVRVIQIPDGAGKDADECLKKNPVVWFEAVKNAREIMDWLFDMAVANKNLTSPKDKQAIANELLPIIGLIPYAVERDHWLKQLSEKINADIAILKEDLTRLQKKVRVTPAETAVPLPPSAPLDAFAKRCERLLLVVLKFNNLFNKVESTILAEVFVSAESAELYEWLKKRYNNASTEPASNLAKPVSFDLDNWQMRSELELADYDEERAAVEVGFLVKEIQEEWLKRRRSNMQHKIAEAQKSGNIEEQKKLLNDFQNLK
ncbi:MAG: DNA primase [Candidatus Magasanikbacteria bacterium RIFOXYD2_FULL_41_14]|uniref:DNA primase n=1 Tax=Candidatus Magasanikbacteria bacterium RIFOXYD2_FULL_41_14 TaxID=1798709 RepID=A0A1F6PG85_9BACT|nr:MAG: DNA primase [Candidatus Magasanikbacteria bacterium RIFOXYD2_FULL_41_14]